MKGAAESGQIAAEDVLRRKVALFPVGDRLALLLLHGASNLRPGAQTRSDCVRNACQLQVPESSEQLATHSR